MHVTVLFISLSLYLWQIDFGLFLLPIFCSLSCRYTSQIFLKCLSEIEPFPLFLRCINNLINFQSNKYMLKKCKTCYNIESVNSFTYFLQNLCWYAPIYAMQSFSYYIFSLLIKSIRFWIYSDKLEIRIHGAGDNEKKIHVHNHCYVWYCTRLGINPSKNYFPTVLEKVIYQNFKMKNWKSSYFR